jgi:hypothetical protein
MRLLVWYGAKDRDLVLVPVDAMVWLSGLDFISCCFSLKYTPINFVLILIFHSLFPNTFKHYFINYLVMDCKF